MNQEWGTHCGDSKHSPSPFCFAWFFQSKINFLYFEKRHCLKYYDRSITIKKAQQRSLNKPWAKRGTFYYKNYLEAGRCPQYSLLLPVITICLFNKNISGFLLQKFRIHLQFNKFTIYKSWPIIFVTGDDEAFHLLSELTLAQS